MAHYVLFTVVLDLEKYGKNAISPGLWVGQIPCQQCADEIWEMLVPPDMLEGVQAQGICIHTKLKPTFEFERDYQNPRASCAFTH